MSDGHDGAGPTGPPVRADGGDAPNLGDYVHEPAVEPDDDSAAPAEVEPPSADTAAADAGGERTPQTSGDAGPGSDATERRRGGEATAPARARERRPPADDPAEPTDDADLLARVAESVDDGSVRGTVAGVAGVYGLFGAGLALLAVLVGRFAPPVVETRWEPYALVSETALLTAVPAVSAALAVLAGGYAAVRLDRVDGAVAGGLGAGLGAVLATWLTVGGVAVGAGGATIRLDGVLVASVFLAVVVGGVAAGVALAADRLGVGAAGAPTDPDSAGDADRGEGASPGEPAAEL